MSLRKTCLWCLSFGLILASSSFAAFPPLFSTGFEEASLKPGSFWNGQGLGTRDKNWSLFANANGVDLQNLAQIQGATVRTGSQALKISAEAGRKIQSGVSTKFGGDIKFLTVSADVFLGPGSRPTVWQFAVGDDGVGFVAGFNVSPEGRLQVMMKGFPWSPPAVKRGTWTRYALLLDFTKQTYDILINGENIAPGAKFLVKSRNARVFQFATFSDGNDAAYLDNVLIERGEAAANEARKPVTSASAAK